MKKASKRMIAWATALILIMSTGIITQAATEISYDMERWTESTHPDGFKITPGIGLDEEAGESVIVSCDKSDIAGNTTQKIKIEHTENATTTVEVTIGEDDANKVCTYYWSFYLASLEEGNGVKLAGLGQETSYFKATTYDYWRKMCVYSAAKARVATLTVTFEGEGVLYLDDVEAETDAAIINGGFEGVSGDGELAGAGARWLFAGNTGNKPMHNTQEILYSDYSSDNSDNKKGAGWYFIETKDGNYIQSVKTARTVYLSYNMPTLRPENLGNGKQYTVSLDFKANSAMDGGVGFESTYGLVGTEPRIYVNPNNGAVTNYILYAKSSVDAFAKRTFTVLYDDSKQGTGSQRPSFRFGTRNSERDDAVGGCFIAYYDNISVAEVKEKVVLTVDGEDTETLKTGKKAHITYSAPLFALADMKHRLDKDTQASYVPHGIKSEKKVTILAALYDVSGENPRLYSIDVKADLQGTTVGYDGNTNMDLYSDLGFMPVSHPFEIDVPKDGNYILKLLVWDSVNGLKPATENEFVFGTAA